MSTKETGELAFPVVSAPGVESYGMTLRDYFAAKAMQALIAKGMDNTTMRNAKGVAPISTFSYEYADAMLEARK